VLENDLIRYEFNADAVLVSAYDKETKRELIRNGANRLAVYVDRPVNWDAWDIDHTYLKTPAENARGISARKIENGSLRQTLAFELAVGKNSKLRQEIRLCKNSKQLDFVTEADWNENHRMLRVSFQTCINAIEAACDIQYGKTMRPTHTNTSWDFARFEAAAHRYVDISDANGGAALLNDCKYGYHLANDTLDLALLRSPKYPDYAADMGSHKFTYSFLPHAGNLVESDVMRCAAQLNRKLILLPGKADIAIPFTLPDACNVTLGTVKKAEKSDDLIIRLVETDGRNGSVKLSFNERANISECDMLEWNDLKEIVPDGDCVKLDFTPFEIKTLRIKRK
jgi:alpha-mannosidase